MIERDVLDLDAIEAHWKGAADFPFSVQMQRDLYSVIAECRELQREKSEQIDRGCEGCHDRDELRETVARQMRTLGHFRERVEELKRLARNGDRFRVEAESSLSALKAAALEYLWNHAKENALRAFFPCPGHHDCPGACNCGQEHFCEGGCVPPKENP